MKQYVVAIDQGTTSSRAIIFDETKHPIAVAQKETIQHFPHPGWVEQNANDIWATTFGVLQEAMAKAGLTSDDIATIGITNQRETTIVWDKATGEPVAPAIVWQCRRTAETCEALKASPQGDMIKERTGLVVDAYFSATKIQWILDRVDPERERAKKGELLFGTVDTWLLWKLTQGKVHATDYTNASRTLLYNIHELKWDEDILNWLNIPRAMLPEVYPSGHYFGEATRFGGVPVTGIAGDQQAALYGQCQDQAGGVKCTYGTGCFLLMHLGKTFQASTKGLVTTLAAGYDDQPGYALEGSIFIGGAVVQWLRDKLHFVTDAADTAFFAQKLEDNEGVYLVPAFVGLGAPYWDMNARGAMYGLSRATGPEHIIRASLEAICYQARDVLEAMMEDTGFQLETLRVDGGAAQNDFLMQFQADILNAKVERPQVVETTAFGAALLAAGQLGLWDIHDLNKAEETEFFPEWEEAKREKYYAGWKEAVRRTLSTT